MRIAALALFALTGCVSFSTLQRADVLAEGTTRVGFAPVELRQEGSRIPDPALPLVASVRHGIGHDWELGGRFWLLGASFGAKYQFLRAEHLAMSVSPELLGSIVANRAGVSFDLALPVLAGIPVGEHQLVLGARVIARSAQLSRTDDGRSLQLFPGAVVGFDFVLPCTGVHLMPEANLSYWPGGHELFWTTTVGVYVESDH